MNEQAPTMAVDAVVMTEYFSTMRQFLDTQSQVMMAIMGNGMAPAPRIAARMPRAIAPPIVAPRPVEPTMGQAHVPPQHSNGRAPAPMASRGNGVAPVATPPPPTPVPTAAPVAAKVEAKAEVPKPAQGHGNANGARESAAAGSGAGRKGLSDILLEIVEEKTGYPRDMVGLDQNLEADLGIDSIKRVEVVGAMLQLLPASQREALTSRRSELNKQATLQGILDLLAASADGAAAAA